MYVFYVIKYGYHDEIFAIFDVKIVLRGLITCPYSIFRIKSNYAAGVTMFLTTVN